MLNKSLQDFLDREPFNPTNIDDFPLAQVLSFIHDGIVVVDARGVIVYGNPSYTRILGVPVERVIGRKMQEVEPNARILKVLETGVPIYQDPFYLDDLQAEVVVDATPLFKNNKIIGGVTVFKKVGEVVGYYNALTKLTELKNKTRTIQKQDEIKDPFKKIIGNDKTIVNTLKKASIVAASNASVLLRGENGVGKEVFAQAIHESSDRSHGPFIKVNCSAIPETLIESELFGYESGAFTGAKKGGKAGKFELANGGTIFLDEIGDMPISVQAKLLRVLQEKEFERIGSSQSLKINFRVIAATNQHLEELIDQNLFREDLYYRINVVTIEIPPLRQRSTDIEMLANKFTEKLSQTYNKKLILSNEVLKRMKEYSWPGNVRQLINVIEHGVIICQDTVIKLEHLPKEILQVNHTPNEGVENEQEINRETFKENTSDTNEKTKIIKALKKTNYNRTQAMKILGISRRTFYKKIKSHDIKLK